MRVAVVGGTGLVGRYTVEALEQAGHEAIVVARSGGVDVTTGAGLDKALAEVKAVVDVTNTTATDPAALGPAGGTSQKSHVRSHSRRWK